jgi:hydrogenase maturation factor
LAAMGTDPDTAQPITTNEWIDRLGPKLTAGRRTRSSSIHPAWVIVPDGVNIHPGQARPGDKILVSGPIAVHGIAIMSVREGLEFETEICSDTTSLAGLVQTMLAASQDIHVLRREGALQAR